MESLLPDPVDAIEAETRINTFWCAYTLERYQLASSLAYSTACNDEDITALLPLKYSDYEAGVSTACLGE
jgi:hypothetical protein